MSAALAGVEAVTPQDATASIKALARHSTSVATTSGIWAALPTQASSAPYVPVALPLTFAVAVTTPRPQYFWVVNTGTVSLSSATYTVTETGALGLTATVEACVGGTWNETTDACTGGTITTVATSSGGATSSSVVPASPAAQVRLRARVSGPPTVAAAVVTTSVAVARANARAATTTYS
jgi:hypothetical protein